MAHATEAELRQMIRELLREFVVDRKVVPPEPVYIASDSEFQTFIARLSVPGTIEAVRAGKLRFTLAGANAAPSSVPSRSLLRGVISERKLGGYTAGETVALTRDAVLTPLARDVARRLGLKIERRDQ